MIPTVLPVPPVLLDTTTRRPSFADALSGADQVKPDVSQDARDAAAELVGIALIQPILAQLHEGQFASEPFGPSDLERRFSPLFDGLMSDRISKAANFPLTEAVARYLTNRSPGGAVAHG